MDRVALAGSLAVHAIAAALVLALAREPGEPEPPRAPVAIELIDVAPASVAPAAPIAHATNGGAVHAGRAAAAPAPREPARFRRAPPKPRTVREAIGPIAIDGATAGEAAAAGGVGGPGAGSAGTGACASRSCGAGIGLGDGGRIALVRDLPAPPVAPPPSKARPAKLIYPVRHREVEDAELFVARVTVDTDGYVVGARLVQGVSGPRDSEASDLIFRFRYAPALDDAGRAIRSTFEQPFAVNR